MGNSQLKLLGNFIKYRPFVLEYHHINNKMLQFWSSDGSENEEYKEQLIEDEDMSTSISDISGDGGVEIVAFVSIEVKGDTKWHHGGYV